MSYALSGTTREIGVGIRRRTPPFVWTGTRYEKLHGMGLLTARQVDRDMGWTKAKLRRYWDQRAKACAEFADEGECLAQVARHVPVTIGGIGMGDTASDIAAALRTGADIIRDPEGTMRVQGPKIVTAVDKHVMTPLMGRMAKAMGPYLVKYVLPPLAILYVLTGVSAYYSYKGYRSRVSANRRRRRRR